MTALQQIVKEAKRMRKLHPNKYAKWTDYVKAASKAIKKPGKKVSGTKAKPKPIIKSAELSKLYGKALKMIPNSPAQLKIRKQIEELHKQGHKLAGKPVMRTKNEHKDTKSHNVNIRVVSGMDAGQTLRELENWKKIIFELQKELKTAPIGFKAIIRQDIAAAKKFERNKKALLKKQLK